MSYLDNLNKASELANNGKHGKAVEFYQTAINQNWDSYQAMQGLAGSLTWLGRFREAMQVQVKSAAWFPEQTPDYFVIKNRVKSKIISSAHNEDLLEYVIQSLNTLIRLLKFNFYANDFLSEMLVIKGDYKTAIGTKYFATICNAAFSKKQGLEVFDQAEGKPPDFLVIGPQKTATTALYSYLIQSPEIYPSINKELFYFNGPSFNYGLDWYKAYFPKPANGYHSLSGEATATYFNDFPIVAKRIYESLPEVKIIFTFRDPAKRAVSDYYMKVRNGLENNGLYESIKNEIDFLNSEKFNDGKPPKNFKNRGFKGYVFFGLYDYFLKNFTRYFKENQILVIRSEDLRSPQESVNKVCDFLNVQAPNLSTKQSVNVGDYPKDEEYDRTMLLLNEFYKNNISLVGNYY